MRKGFTMIELIFVIVIIGILAAIAIPRLATTRGDAEAIKIMDNFGTCIDDAGGAYVKTKYFSGDSTKPNQVPTNSTACNRGLLTNWDSEKCFTIAVTDSSGAMVIKNNNFGNSICVKAHNIANAQRMSSNIGVVYNF